MIYDYALTIPANTPIATPATLHAALNLGTLTRLEIQFPAGCAGLVGVGIWRYEVLTFPSNPGAWFIADNHVIAFDEDFLIDREPYALSLRGYNLDDTYPHTIYFRFGVTAKGKTLGERLGGLFRISPSSGGVF
jgi:hypothetical protein